MNRRGFTLLEVVVALAVFGIFLMMLGTMTTEMARQEKRFPLSYFQHPSIDAVSARVRRDVEDTTDFPPAFQGQSPTAQLLMLYTVHDGGKGETVTYDFTKPGEVTRSAYTATLLTSQWVAHGVPQFTVRWDDPSDPKAIVLTATDTKGAIVVDELIYPRPHS